MKKIFVIILLLSALLSRGQAVPFSSLPVYLGNLDSVRVVGLLKSGSAYTNRTFYGIDFAKDRLLISDSAAMLLNYARAFNYYTKAESEGRYYSISNPDGFITSSAITGKVNYTDTANMLATYKASMISNTSAILLRVLYSDTASMLTAYRLSLIADNASILLRMRFTDTASMLANYRHWGQGYLKAADITGKLNVSDTGSMLSPYLRSLNAAASYQPIGSYATTSGLNLKVNISDTAGMLAAYRLKDIAQDASIAGKENALGFTAENVANKSTSTSLGTSDALYPSQKAVKTYVDNAITAAGGYTDEAAQDAIGTILSGEFTYADATPLISINAIAQSKITGLISDLAGKISASDTASMLSHYLTAIIDQAANKVDKTTTVNGHALSSNVTVTKSDVGLSNVDNTSDAGKPVSTATQTALNLKVNIGDTSSMLSPYLRSLNASQTYQPVGSYATTSQLATKVNISDTTSMLSNYLTGLIATVQKVKYSDTASMLSNYKTAMIVNNAAIPLKVNIADTAAMLSPYLRSLNASQTYQPVGSYATTSQNALKVNISDTSSMLANYLTGLIATAQKVKYTDTASMLSNYKTAMIANNAAIPLKVNISDTSGMLSPYLRSLNASQTYATIPNLALKVNIADTAAMLSNYKTAMIANTANIVTNTSNIALKVNISDTATMLNNYRTAMIATANNATATLTNKTLTSPIINVGSDAQGDIYYRNSSGALARLAPGTSGQLLKTNGAGADPSWVTSSATNYWTQTGSDVANNNAGEVRVTPASSGVTYPFRTMVTGGTNTLMAVKNEGQLQFFGGTSSPVFDFGYTNVTNPGFYLAEVGVDYRFTIFKTTGNAVIGNAVADPGYKLDVAGTLRSSAQTHNAGSTSAAPENYTLSGASLLTSSTAGALEVDANGIQYYSHDASARGVVDAEQFISLTSTYTLSSSSSLQKLFNSTTNGAMTVKGSTSYFFECEFDLSSMSASSGAFSFGFGGTATITSLKYTAVANKAAIGTATASLMTTATVATATALVAANTTTTGHARISGIVRVNAGGTLIPQVALGVAAAAVVGTNSWFRITPIGTNTVTNIGNWN
jgi:hypothetical protein